MKFSFRHFILLGSLIALLPTFIICIVLIAGLLKGERLSFPPSDLPERAQAVFAENETQWREAVRKRSEEANGAGFMLLKQFWFSVSGYYAVIVYDPEDEIKNVRGLHLPFWRAQIEHLSSTIQPMGHVFAHQIDGHFYWLYVHSSTNGYALEKRGTEYKIIKWNCSTFVEPVTQACPDQWHDGPNGPMPVRELHPNLHSIP